MPLKDLTGQRFGRLTVTSRAPSGKNWVTMWNTVCDCGTPLLARASNLVQGQTNSCGCLRKDVTGDRQRKHGLSHTGAYHSWRSARYRCTDPLSTAYPYYGGRGITMCDRWLDSFEKFFEDMGERPKGLTLERKRVNEGYSPDNCEWATRSTQMLNRRCLKQYLLEGVWMNLLQIQQYLQLSDHHTRQKAKTLPSRPIGTSNS